MNFSKNNNKKSNHLLRKKLKRDKTKKDRITLSEVCNVKGSTVRRKAKPNSKVLKGLK